MNSVHLSRFDITVLRCQYRYDFYLYPQNIVSSIENLEILFWIINLVYLPIFQNRDYENKVETHVL